jgi:hypothetical protein
MKCLPLFTLGCALFFGSAHAATMTCSDLVDGNGVPQPGISRPTVEFTESGAVIVQVVMSGMGGSGSFGQSWSLFPTARDGSVYMSADREAQLRITRESRRINGGSLELKGFYASCQF